MSEMGRGVGEGIAAEAEPSMSRSNLGPPACHAGGGSAGSREDGTVIDTGLLDQWAARAGLAPQRRPEAEMAWGDIEVAFGIREKDDRFEILSANRGHWLVDGVTSSRDSAVAMLLAQFGQLWRSFNGLRDPFPAGPAAGSRVSSVAEGHLAQVKGEHGVFRREDDARVFTYVANRPHDDIAALMRNH